MVRPKSRKSAAKSAAYIRCQNLPKSNSFLNSRKSAAKSTDNYRKSAAKSTAKSTATNTPYNSTLNPPNITDNPPLNPPTITENPPQTIRRRLQKIRHTIRRRLLGWPVVLICILWLSNYIINSSRHLILDFIAFIFDGWFSICDFLVFDVLVSDEHLAVSALLSYVFEFTRCRYQQRWRPEWRNCWTNDRKKSTKILLRPRQAETLLPE